MKTLIYYYTGTGNSLWVAKEIQKEISSSKLCSLSKEIDEASFKEADLIGFVFPVHIWGVPHAVIDFLERIPHGTNNNFFAVAVNAGQVSRTLLQLQELLAKKDNKLLSGFSIKMPSNYIPWGSPCSKEKQTILFSEAQKRIGEISKILIEGKSVSLEKGPLWQRVLFTWIYKLSFKHVPSMDKKFFADERCNGCGICEKICPAENILMKEKPQWKKHCEQCFACLQWCPKEAIQYGEKTVKYERYHHPEILIKDLLQR